MSLASPLPWLVTSTVPIFSASIFVVGFLYLSAAVGRRLMIWLRASDENHAGERTIVSIALGLGVLELVPMAFGAIGRLGTTSLGVAFGLIALLVVRDLAAIAAGMRQVPASWTGLPRWARAWWLALVPGLLVTYLLALTPAIDPDGLGYHLTVPKRWLAAGTLAYLPTYPNSNMPMGVEMLFTTALAVAGDAAAKLIHFALGVAGAVGLYLAGKQLRRIEVGVVAATGYLFGPVGVAPLLGWAYVEGAVSFALIASALGWLVWFRTRQSGWLRVAFLAAGVAVTFKITAGLFPLALGTLTLLIVVNDAREGGGSVRAAVLGLWPGLVLVAVPMVPWMLRATIMTGNPVFPMFARWIPSRDFSPDLAADWERFNLYLNWASSVGASWTIEFRQMILVTVCIVVTAIAGVTFLVLRSWTARSATIAVWATVVVQIAAVGLYRRYWIPLLCVLQLPLLMLFASRLAGRWQRIAIVAVTAAASMVHAQRTLRGVDGLTQTALGLQDQRDFLIRHLPLYSLYEYANRELPPDSRIVLVSYCGGFHLDRTTFCTDIVQGSLRITTWEEFLTDARRLGVTHVMAPKVLAAGGVQGPPAQSGVGYLVAGRVAGVFGRLLPSRGRLLISAADQGLYEVDLSGGN
jgi:hypothetical protein